jgi:hypothetical protein
MGTALVIHIDNNIIGGDLKCSGNSVGATNDSEPNTVAGECSAL